MNIARPESWRWPNFTADEFVCRHTGLHGMRADFLDRLQLLRTKLDFPFEVSSGYRNPDHPIESGKDPADDVVSPHETGRAVDIRCSHTQAYLLLEAAPKYGFTGIGVNQRGNARFIHLDDLWGAAGRPRPHVWSY